MAACFPSGSSAGLGTIALKALSTFARSAPDEATYSGSAVLTAASSQLTALNAASMARGSFQLDAVS
eukprot:CAMPEP_0172705162 /NCGR_PEP_ID=MMETSP1074-20121228/42620_1 /TAXON_ID=2916 /ORGANISM="Ceratium fusus, Strain PA161109" /LENGTH=66 /DNA_ID=CAMNT_0013527453 /DNA_START=53 /DNA_END=253 /DNA_ORIENTATION=+